MTRFPYSLFDEGGLAPGPKLSDDNILSGVEKPAGGMQPDKTHSACDQNHIVLGEIS